MADDRRALADLARAVGLADTWQDADGLPQQVVPDDLAAILDALGYPGTSEAERRRSLDRLAEEQAVLPALLTADLGVATALPPALASARTADLLFESGAARPLSIEAGRLPAVDQPGYHRLSISGHVLTLAVAPSRSHALGGAPAWGPAVQIPSLRADGPYGDFDALRQVAGGFAKAGADLVAISPVHALFPGRCAHYSPYAPSSRQFLNSALAISAASLQDELIDWGPALAGSLDALRAMAAALPPAEREHLRAQASPDLKKHALFDALYLHHGGVPWQQWPIEHRDPDSPASLAFAEAHAGRIDVHLLAQSLATRKLAAAQAAARGAGMRIGLIADLAVGVDPGGSDVWANQGAFLQGLTIGAPPDPLGPSGQNWGLTGLSPWGLRHQGLRPWIALIRAALSQSGGVRIDHAFGLQRLWVIPEGAPSRRGAYLAYPLDDLLRILTLESHRHRAIIIAEDLGTTPAGFRGKIEARGMSGMKVLWFERSADGFTPAPDYPADSVAMTGTHDTATVAGWWTGRDLYWRGVVDPATTADALPTRQADRALLWRAIGQGPQPDDQTPAPVVDAAIAHVAATASRIKIVPLEDLIGLEEQPNLPGTLDEHPNWRRRLPVPVDRMLARPDIAARMAALDRASRPAAKDRAMPGDGDVEP